MQLELEKVPGEIALYRHSGEVLFDDAYLWHSAGRGTDANTKRRHIRGTFHRRTEQSSMTILTDSPTTQLASSVQFSQRVCKAGIG